MRHAIDRYAVGVEEEVCADDFDDQYYIPRRRNRFFCPECGEVVYFRTKGGKHPNQFYHQDKTDRTPECDKRVDGRSELTLSQRVGLPIYLTGIISGHYQLNIGFPALGAEMLDKAAKSGYTVEISSGNQYRTVKVDQTNFINDATTLIPVNFIPADGRNYIITITGERPVFGLQKKWSDYADGFDSDGAIFTYEETGGRKVHRGDSISTNRSYFAVIKNNLPFYPEIHQTEIGILKVGRDSYRVLKIEITVSVGDKGIFSAISTYLSRHFGVWLLECQPELIPVWPPVVQQDYQIPIMPEANILCAVSSGNINPNVYVYSDYGVHKKEIHRDYSDVCTVELSLGKRPVTLSVDRKYVGREVTFFSKEIPRSKYVYELRLTSIAGDAVIWENVDEKFLSTNFVLQSNSKLEMYIGSKDKCYRHINIREKTTVIPARANTNEIYLVVESGIIRQLRINKPIGNQDDDERLLELIRASRKGCMVSIPRWADAMIRDFKRNHNEAMYDVVVSATMNGKIYVEVLRKLRMLELTHTNATQNGQR